MAILSSKGQCPACPITDPVKPLINKLCQYHYYLELRMRTNLRGLQGHKDPGLKQWYEHCIMISDWVCENCGAPIPCSTESLRYSAQAHILPKEHFPSVKLNFHNRLHLGNYFGCNCHNLWDSSWASAGSMNVLGLARQRFDYFKDQIDPSELKRLPHIFTH